jgi:phage terminase small subunit
MGFSSRLKAHRHLLTLETLKFIVEYLQCENARMAALNSGIPETYASRQGQWLKKLPLVKAALEQDLEEPDIKKLQLKVHQINILMEECKELLGMEE